MGINLPRTPNRAYRTEYTVVLNVLQSADLMDYIGGDVHLAFTGSPARLLYGTLQGYEIRGDALQLTLRCLGEARSSVPEFPPPSEWSRHNYLTTVTLSIEGSIEPHRITFARVAGGPLGALYPPNSLAPF